MSFLSCVWLKICGISDTQEGISNTREDIGDIEGVLVTHSRVLVTHIQYDNNAVPSSC